MLHSADVYGRTGRDTGACDSDRLDMRDFEGPTELSIVFGVVAVGCGVGALDGVVLLRTVLFAGKITLPREPAATGLRSKGIKPPIVIDIIRLCVC